MSNEKIKSMKTQTLFLDGLVAKAIRLKEEETGKLISPLAEYAAAITVSENNVRVEIPGEDIDVTFKN